MRRAPRPCLLLLIRLPEPIAVLVVLPRAAAFSAVVEFVVGGQQVAVLRHGGQQLRVRADVRDRAVAQQRDLVGEQHRRRPMRDHDARHRVQHPAQRLLDDGLGVHVERGQRVVEHEDLGRGEDGPRQRQPLPLPAGQAHALFADAGVQPERQVVDELRGGDLDGLRQLLVRRVRPAEPQVLRHRHREQRRVLERGGHRLPQRRQAQLADVLPVDANRALGDVVQP